MKWGWLFLSALLVSQPIQAEIYKWRDKDGSIRYSDTPPPSNIKNESILGKKNPRPAATAASAQSEQAKATSTNTVNSAKEGDQARQVEEQKKTEATRQAELKFRQESCAVARKNLAMYMSGGRIMTTDASGERQYLGDDEIAKAKQEAQEAVAKFCDD